MCPLQNTLYLALLAELNDQFLISNQIRREFSKFYIHVVPLWFETCRVVETIFAVLQEIPEENLDLIIISLDRNNIYFRNILMNVCGITSDQWSCFLFEDTLGHPIYSYILLGDQNCLVEIHNKFIFLSNCNNLYDLSMNEQSVLNIYPMPFPPQEYWFIF